MLWLDRSLAKARGETQPFIGMFSTIILWFQCLCYYVFDRFTHIEKCLVLYNPLIYRRLRAH